MTAMGATDYFFSRSLTKLGFEKTADLKKDEGIDKRIFDTLDRLKEIKDSILVLMTAMGATDYWGSNKNGDYFLEKDLWLDSPLSGHKTFKDAGVFRHHKNNNKDETLGQVLNSIYNPKMHRVELIVRIDRDKCEKWNHPDLFEQLMEGSHEAVSMGVKIPYDQCSICGTKAKTKSDYCEHIRRMLNEIMPDGRKVTMINRPPLKFFDISFVRSPADTTAGVLEFLDDKEIKKTASTYIDLLAPTIIKTASERKIKNKTEYKGIPIDIEFSNGTVRKGKGWSTLMKCHYGKIPGTKGNDKDCLDCYLSKDPKGEEVYIINQIKDDGKFDEEKVMIGFPSIDEAKEMYLKHIPKNKFGAIASLPIEKFKKRFGLIKEAEKKIALIKQIPMNIVSTGKNLKQLKKN
jgi:hypothetical protein